MITPSSLIPHISFDFNDTKSVIIAAALLVCAVATSAAAAKCVSEKHKTNKSRTTAIFTLVTFAATCAMILFYGATATVVKGVVLTVILLYASVEDIKTKECPDYLHVMVLITAFIGTDLSSIPYMAMSALFAGGIMLLTLLMTKSDIGGADIKMATAASFALGMTRGAIGLVAGMILAIVFNIFKEDRKKGFPMIPYLAAGYIAAFLI